MCHNPGRDVGNSVAAGGSMAIPADQSQLQELRTAVSRAPQDAEVRLRYAEHLLSIDRPQDAWHQCACVLYDHPFNQGFLALSAHGENYFTIKDLDLDFFKCFVAGKVHPAAALGADFNNHTLYQHFFADKLFWCGKDIGNFCYL